MGAASLDGLKVLLVEDDALVSMLLEDMLSELGCHVIGPATGVEDALALLDRKSVDCAVLDVKVRDGPVYPVAEALRARGCPFAFSTGYPEAALPEAHRSAPVLQKPFRAGDLRDVLARLASQVTPAVAAPGEGSAG